MAGFAEKAAKAAGIHDISRGYPRDDKQRGASFWAGFIASIRTQDAAQDEERERLLRELAEAHKSNAKQAKDIARLSANVIKGRAENLTTELGEAITVNQRERLLGVAN